MRTGRVELDGLVEHWTLLDDDLGLVAGKRGATRLGFALLLKFFTRHGRFPAGRVELAPQVVEFVAQQVQVDPATLGTYSWAGRTIEYHRAQIRQALGFRECTTGDADKLTGWLAEHVAQTERHPEQVREELLGRCRSERIEPPSAGRVERIVRSGLHQAEETLCQRVVSRLAPHVAARIEALVAVGDDAPGAGTGDGPSLFALIKSGAGNVSLETMLTEIDKLEAVRAIGLPAGLFDDIAPKVVAAWRARAAVEAPSHLRTHPQPLRLALVAALLRAPGAADHRHLGGVADRDRASHQRPGRTASD